MGTWPAAGSPGDASGLARSFERADQQYGPLPIWWSGERLEPARLRGQMEQLCAQDVTQAVVSTAGPSMFDQTEPGDSVLLDLGAARGAAEVLVNQTSAARLTLSPYQTDITAYLRPGANDLEAIVRATLAGYLGSASPSPAVTPRWDQRGLLARPPCC